MLDVDKREAIASLKGHRGYIALLEDLEGGIEAILGALAAAKADEEVLRLGRKFQVVFQFQHLLKMTPETILDDIESEVKALVPSGDPLMTPARQQLLATLEAQSILKGNVSL